MALWGQESGADWPAAWRQVCWAEFGASMPVGAAGAKGDGMKRWRSRRRLLPFGTVRSQYAVWVLILLWCCCFIFLGARSADQLELSELSQLSELLERELANLAQGQVGAIHLGIGCFVEWSIWMVLLLGAVLLGLGSIAGPGLCAWRCYAAGFGAGCVLRIRESGSYAALLCHTLLPCGIPLIIFTLFWLQLSRCTGTQTLGNTSVRRITILSLGLLLVGCLLSALAVCSLAAKAV